MTPAECEVMSNLPEPELDLDLQFLPSWAKQAPATNRYAKFTGEEESFDQRRDGRRGDRRPPPRRDGDRPQGGGRPAVRLNDVTAEVVRPSQTAPDSVILARRGTNPPLHPGNPRPRPLSKSFWCLMREALSP